MNWAGDGQAGEGGLLVRKKQFFVLWIQRGGNGMVGSAGKAGSCEMGVVR